MNAWIRSLIVCSACTLAAPSMTRAETWLLPQPAPTDGTTQETPPSQSGAASQENPPAQSGGTTPAKPAAPADQAKPASTNAGPAEARTGAQAEAKPGAAFTTEQIEQMVAPIALYPDGLLMQIMMGATYPLEIVEAQRWVAKNTSL